MTMAISLPSRPQPPVRPSAVTDICDGRIFAVSGYVPAARPATWILSGLEGHLAVSCYVLIDGGHAMIIDTGLAAHRDEVGRSISWLLADCRRRELIMTRREPDAIINLPFLVKEVELDAVFCGGVLNPLDFFERVDQKSLESHVSAIAHASVEWAKPGSALPIGALSLEILRTTVVVLPKTHLYEQRTGTLFGSDTWGFLSQLGTSSLDIVTAWDERLSRGSIARYLRHKFDWLCGIDTSVIEADLALLKQYDIRRICSTYGGVIEGALLASRVIDETIEAVQLLSREPIVDRLKGFDRTIFEAAL
ncbi:hypothetical protein [Bosea psychrotolerans]|uniref:Glyoxylase-like metal-dependent hydrolase (Beta-lactamase superfamily II) n=1 Tax=Bosea psychrotolerans TaxID=1871628 RepID=A0A2S4MBC7_9HYPH|nr:hypothetical protein [Bosea psychrotolerans]POR51945.1 hypothetical protein CYD53_106229 [Bosea psychrotolerans]